MGIKKKDPANFSPSVEIPAKVDSFRFWCQKVLPLVYDDSLSYYELLCKVVNYLNNVIADVNTLGTDVDNLNNAYNELQSYVNDYFSTLDVQNEINNKLDEMAQDGSLSALIQPLFDTYKTEINSEVNQQNNKIGVLENRMNMFTSLPSGSTSGDAELIDIRVPASGFNNNQPYANAGDAVRGQVSSLKEELAYSLINNISAIIKSINKCDAEYDGTTLKVNPNDSSGWWSVTLTGNTFIYDVSNFSNKAYMIVAEDDNYVYGFDARGVNNSFVRLNKNDKNFTSTGLANLTQIANYPKIYLEKTTSGFKLYGINGEGITLIENYDLSSSAYWGGLSNKIAFGLSQLRPNEIIVHINSYVKAITEKVLFDTDLSIISKITDKYKNKKVFFYGDSITDQGTWIDNCVSYLNITQYTNYGVSGAPLQQVSDRTSIFQKIDTTIKNLSDLEKPDIIVLWGGTNDYGLNLPIGDNIDDTGLYNLRGALNRIFALFHDNVPNAQIIVISPMQRNTNHEVTPTEVYDGLGPNGRGSYVIDYFNAIKDACDKWAYPYLDLYHTSGINQTNARDTAITRNGDGLHPSNTYGANYLSQIIAKFIEQHTSTY